MQSDIRTSQHRTKEIGNFRGVVTNIADPRNLSPSMQSLAQDCMFDSAGGVRPRDGYSRFWPNPIPQRLQLADFEPAEAWNSLPGETWSLASGASLDTAAPYAGVRNLKCGSGSGTFSGTSTRSTLSISVDPIRSTSNGSPLGLYARLKPVGQGPTGLNLITSVTVTLTTSVGSHVFSLPASTLIAVPVGVWTDVFFSADTFVAGETITAVEINAVTYAYVSVYGVLHVDDVRLQAVPAGLSSGMDGLLNISALASNAAGVFTGCNDSFPNPRNFYYDYRGNRGTQTVDALAYTAYSASGSFRPATGEIPFGAYNIIDAAYNAAGDLLQLTDGFYAIDWVTGQPYRSNNDSFVTRIASDNRRYTWKSQADLVAYKGSYSANSLACAPNGNVFVGMLNNAIFDSTGTLVASSAFNSQVRGASFDSNNNLFEVDPYDVVRRFDITGSTYDLAVNTSSIALTTGASPVHCCHDYFDNLYVVEQGLFRITKYDNTGTYVSTWGTQGYGDGQFQHPTRITYTPRGTLLVADSLRGDVQEFSDTGTFLRKFAPTAGFYEDSFAVGLHEFRKIGAPQSRILAMFGETLWSDLNNAKTPAKIKSGFTRNVPTRFINFENRVLICNGQDDNLVYTGMSCRKAGYPVPTWTNAPTLTPSTSGGEMAAGTYHYWMSFVYGEGTTDHGESTAVYIGSATVASGTTGSVALGGTHDIPVGALGSGVTKRRIYRSLVDADERSTAYFDHEIADNTTVVYTSIASDTDIVFFDTYPTDNGIPPKAKYAVYFQKGMVYLNGLTVANSRPGTNLNETPETVPATALNILPNYGEITGAQQLGANLYIFQEGCIHAAEWVESDLAVRPVLAAKANGHGAVDQSQIVVWKGESLIFKDPSGKIWQMLQNESISEVTESVDNLFADSNPERPSNQFYSYHKASAAEWESPTVGTKPGSIGANIALLDDGGLTYQYPQQADVTIATMVPAVSNVVSVDKSSALSSLKKKDLWGTSSWESLYATKQPVRLTGVSFQVSTLGQSIPPAGNCRCWYKAEVVKIGVANEVEVSQSSGNLLSVLNLAGGSVVLKMESSLDFRKSTSFDPAQSLLSQASYLNTVASSSGVLVIEGTSFSWSNTDSLNTIISSINADVDLGVKAFFDSSTGIFTLEAYEASAGTVLWTSTEQTVDASTSTITGSIAFTGASVYIPAGDRVIVRLKRRDAADTAYWGTTKTSVYLTTLSGSGFSSVSNGIAGSLSYSVMLRTEIVSSVIDSASFCPTGESLVRWGAPVMTNAYLRGGAALSVYLETSNVSTRGADLSASGLADSKIATMTRQNDIGWKAFPEPNYALASAYLYPVRDYRNGETGVVDITPAMSPRRRYAWIRVVLDPTAVVATPDMEAHSRTSTDITDAFPSIESMTVAFTSQPDAAVAAAFDRTAYTEDQYISEPVYASSLGQFGTFSSEYTQGQHQVFFSIRMASSIANLAAAPWQALTVGESLSSSLIPASASYFQLRVQFEDRRDAAVGYDAEAGYPYVGTFVRSMSISWGTAGSLITSPTQGALLEVSGCLICSWPSRDSSAVNRTMYIDQHIASDGSLSWRFSVWTGKHFTSMCNAVKYALASPQTGGVLYELFTSAIGDDEHGWPGAVYGRPAVIATLANQFSTPFLKTIQDMFVGVDLAKFKDGYRTEDLSFYPQADAPAGQEVPYFKWAVSTTPAGNGIVVSANPTMMLTDKTAGQVYTQRLSHGGTGNNSATDTMKPYCTEYWFDVGAQEYAFVIAVQLIPFKDTDGNSIYPTLSGIGVGYWVDNIRGV